APTSVAPRMRTAWAGIDDAFASPRRGLSGWQAISAPQPWLRSQRTSASVRISWPPWPREDSVCRTVCMKADYCPACSSEKTRTAGVPVGHDTRGFDAADRRESFAQALVGGGKGQTAHEEFDRHGRAPSDRTGLSEYTLWSSFRKPNLARGADLVVSFIEQLGYAGLFWVLFVAGLGVPIPEELPIVTAGVLSHQLVLRWWIALPVCLLGVLSGDVA